MMGMNGMYVICANSIEEAERDLEMMKLAASLGQPLGGGGMTLDKAETAIRALAAVVGLSLEEDEDDCCECCGCEDCTCEDEEEGDELLDFVNELSYHFANCLYDYAIGEKPIEAVRRETTKAIREVRDFMS